MAKKSKKPRKRKINNPTKEQVFSFLYVLEENDMNMTQTAKEIGVARNSMYRYKERYWDEYVAQKPQITKNAVFARYEKEKMDPALGEAKERTLALYFEAIEMAEKMLDLDDETQKRKMAPKDVVNLINALAPYVTEKVGIIDKDQQPGQTTFVQNIINHMNNYRNKNNTDVNE